ncbi:hypothetical protein AKO1_001416, partial [Acrasis kona]
MSWDSSVHDKNIIIIGDIYTRKNYLTSYIHQNTPNESHKKLFILSTSKEKVLNYADSIMEHANNHCISVYTGSEAKVDVVKTMYAPMLKKIKFAMKSSLESWVEQINNNDILLTIAPLFQEALSKGLIPIEKIKAVIIDESNNCVGNHPYNRILANIASLSKDQQPRIVGLAAIPASVDVSRWKSNMLCEEIIEQQQQISVTDFDKSVVLNKLDDIECFIYSFGASGDVSHVLYKIFSSMTTLNPRVMFVAQTPILVQKHYTATQETHPELTCHCVSSAKSKETLNKIPLQQVVQEFKDQKCNVVFSTDIFNSDLLPLCDALIFSDRISYTRTLSKLKEFNSRIIV